MARLMKAKANEIEMAMANGISVSKPAAASKAA
jgi:hypothetical protein